MVKKVLLVQHEGKQDDNDEVNVMHLHLDAFVLSNSKRIMNNFVEAIGGFKTIDVYYGDTDSLYIESKHWKKINLLGFVGKDMLQGKNNYKNEGVCFLDF